MRETLIVGQLVAVPDEERHRVDVCDGQEDTLPVRLTVPDIEKDPDTVDVRHCV